jgi:hypothetical protein
MDESHKVHLPRSRPSQFLLPEKEEELGEVTLVGKEGVPGQAFFDGKKIDEGAQGVPGQGPRVLHVRSGFETISSPTVVRGP